LVAVVALRPVRRPAQREDAKNLCQPPSGWSAPDDDEQGFLNNELLTEANQALKMLKEQRAWRQKGNCRHEICVDKRLHIFQRAKALNSETRIKSPSL